MTNLPLTVLAQNSLKITVGWTPPAGVTGYVFSRDGQRVSSSFDPTKNQVTFGIPDAKPHTFWVTAVGDIAAGVVSVNQPAPSGKLWGISPSNNNGFSPSISVQMAEFVKLGINCPRIPGDDASAAAAKAAGFTQWIAWCSGDGSASIASVVAYAKKYPEAIGVGFGNELNLDGNWTAAKVAAKQIQLYQAMKAAGLPNKVMLSSLAQSPSKSEGLQNLPYCKKLAAAGCVVGKGLDWADLHCYPYPSGPASFEKWQHIHTPDGNGDSCVSVLGGAPFFISECGARIPNEAGDEQAQAAAATAIVDYWNSVPSCLGGAWFQAFDGTGWAGFGLIDAAGNRRPSWQAFHDAIA